MRLRVRGLALLVTILLAGGCTAAQISVAPDASRVRTGTRPPDGAYDQLGAITAKHGGGCGLYGTRGNLEGAYTILRSKATQLGADYVQILRVTEPHLEGICMYQGYVIDGLANKLTSKARAQGLTGTYAGTISATAQGQTLSVRVTFTVVQSGDEIAGAWNTNAGASGTIAGKVRDGRLSEFRARQLNPCAGEFLGAADIEAGGDRLLGVYTGNDCGGAVTASFNVSRQ